MSRRYKKGRGRRLFKFEGCGCSLGEEVCQCLGFRDLGDVDWLLESWH